MAKQPNDKSSSKAPTASASEQDQELDDAELDKISGGTNGLKLLAQVSHLQSQSADADLTQIADRQRDAVSTKKKRTT